MAECSNCLHFEVCALRYEKLCKGTLVEDLIHDCSKFKDRREWLQQKQGQWKYGARAAVCSECGFERHLDDNFGSAIACPNCNTRMV